MTQSPRRAARALLLDQRDNIFLLCIQANDRSQAYWITPGGGLEGHEDPVSALCRELQEEVSLELAPHDIGPCVWTRTHSFHWLGRDYVQSERFFVVRLSQVMPPLRLRASGPEEAETLREGRWWSQASLQAPDILFAPRRLACWLARLCQEPLPTEPLDISAVGG